MLAMRTALLTACAMLAFAGNSILCRLALADGAIDPNSFTAVRLTSGALVLLPFLRPVGGALPASSAWSPAGAIALIVYACAFSWAYVTLAAGMGALLLFGSVQLTMLATGLARGERMTRLQLVGLTLALSGLVVQCAPGITAPDPLGALMMIAAGVGWGVYSLLGRGSVAPRVSTARNFLLAAPVAVLVWFIPLGGVNISAEGTVLAAASGALTSGLGYVLWYAALRGHSTTSAAHVQLSVPVLAALGGVVLLNETLEARFAIAAALVLGGIAVAIRSGRTDSSTRSS